MEEHFKPEDPILRSVEPSRECPPEPWYVTKLPEEMLGSEIDSHLHPSMSSHRLPSVELCLVQP